MYEDKTFENILSEMLTYVGSRNSELDTRIGSLIYTSLAPIALELETVYRNIAMTVDETFIETASKDYLIKHGSQIGVDINEATYGHFKGEFNVDVPIGSRFSLDRFNYTVINKLSDPTGENQYYTFGLVCETSGEAPNNTFGNLTPITYVKDLSYAKLTSVLVYGEEEEDTEAYRYRLQIHMKKPPIDGNVSQYAEWLDNYDGIGKYRILPCWNGLNTVKLMILNSEDKAASDEFLQQVQQYFDPPTSAINDNVEDATYPQGRGMGNGQAPIGSIVTIKTVNEVPVKIVCTLKLKEGYTSPVGVEEAVNNYLNSIVLNKTTIGYMPISAEIYNAESVEDVLSLAITVKGTVMDAAVTPFVDSVTLADDEIGVLDTTNSVWGV